MRLLPRKTTFFDLFDQHAESLVLICRELRDMWRDFDHLPERQARVKDLEHRCDQLTHQLALEMHATFVTPLDKEDIAALASGLDDIADYADAVGDRIILYQIGESTPEARELSEILVQCAEVLQSTVRCLRSLNQKDSIMNSFREIHRLENESDVVYRRAVGMLFNTPGADPITVMKWKEIYERLEMAVDKCEDVSNVVEAVYLKYA